jgi:hypothetical protein
VVLVPLRRIDKQFFLIQPVCEEPNQTGSPVETIWFVGVYLYLDVGIGSANLTGSRDSRDAAAGDDQSQRDLPTSLWVPSTPSTDTHPPSLPIPAERPFSGHREDETCCRDRRKQHPSHPRPQGTRALDGASSRKLERISSAATRIPADGSQSGPQKQKGWRGRGDRLTNQKLRPQTRPNRTGLYRPSALVIAAVCCNWRSY